MSVELCQLILLSTYVTGMILLLTSFYKWKKPKLIEVMRLVQGYSSCLYERELGFDDGYVSNGPLGQARTKFG